jgi:cytochrome b561
MPRRAPELWYAAGAILATTLGYGATYVRADALPSASGLVGHGIGIAGFILMLMTATLYSVRKLRTAARWGSMAAWLRFHMVTGLVGPYMVLLHTAMRFRGLAGLATLLTAVVVVSGLIGRYLYTAVPRDVEDAVSGGGAGAPPGRGRGALPGGGSGPPREGRESETSADERDVARRRARLARRRRALAVWHTLHVPLAWALFAAAFVHVVAALYYATLQR